MIFIKELSLNILDIVTNSVKAKATLIEIIMIEKDNLLTININDNGCGMSEEMVKRVTDPFCTTRTTRKVGLGVPFFLLAAQQTGGSLEISSVEESKDKVNHGTKLTAVFHTDSIDFTPIGDIISTVVTLIHGSPEIDFYFLHRIGDKKVELDTRLIRETLGNDVPLNSFEVIGWIKDSLETEYKLVK